MQGTQNETRCDLVWGPPSQACVSSQAATDRGSCGSDVHTLGS